MTPLVTSPSLLLSFLFLPWGGAGPEAVGRCLRGGWSAGLHLGVGIPGDEDPGTGKARATHRLLSQLHTIFMLDSLLESHRGSLDGLVVHTGSIYRF